MRVRSFVKQLSCAIVNDNITDTAAMMAYYAVMSLFPMNVCGGSLSLLVLPDTTVMMGVHMAGEALPPGVRPILVDRVQVFFLVFCFGFVIGGGLVALWG